MALKPIYQRFLDLPNPLSLTENASLHYVTTLSSFSKAINIVQHLEYQNRKVVKTKKATIISAIEGPNALALEVEMVLEFISGGGNWLPGLENFVVDKIAVIPTTHIVYFDAEQKISQIRITWDQGSLLKQTEVIGSRGNNWPISDGRDQVRLISTGFKAAPTAAPGIPRGRTESQSLASSRSVSPSKKHIKDPHASLNLFSPTAPQENERQTAPNAVQPRASARPPQREMSELFAAGHEDNEPGSPKKIAAELALPPKGASSKKFAPSRLFDDGAGEPAPVGYKSNPAKYNHFDLGDDMDDDPMQHPEPEPKAKAVPLRARSDKGKAQWDFADFTTPVKLPSRARGQDVVHFSLGGSGSDVETPVAKPAVGKPRRDNESHFEMQDDGTPIERQVVHKPRKDADTHFQMRDVDTPAANRTSGRPASSAGGRGGRGGLYDNNLYDEEETAPPQEKAPLSTITNNTNRRQDFDSHWSMGDTSPAPGKGGNENKPTGEGRKRAPQAADSHWDSYDEPSEPLSMAGTQGRLRKGMESTWRMGDEESTTPNGVNKTEKSFWDF